MQLLELDDPKHKIRQLKKFVQWMIDRTGIKKAPVVTYGTSLDQVKSKRTFGSTGSNGEIWVHISNRNMADVMRTLCHELIHHKQFEVGTAYDGMDEEQRQYIEDEANAFAGRLMREYGQEHEEIYESTKREIDSLVKTALNEMGQFKPIIK